MLGLLCVSNSWWQRCSWNLEVVVIEGVVDLAGTLVNIYIYQMNTRQQVRLTENIDQQPNEDTPISMTSSSDTDVLTLLTQQLLRIQEDADRERRRRDEKVDRDRKAAIERDERFHREAEDRESRIREQALEDAEKRDARFLELQQELEERRRADAKRDREEREVKPWQSKVHTILTWKDQDDPEVYIQQFERWMAIHKVPKTAWAELLPNVLEGIVRTIYHTDISDADVGNYDKVKELLLAALGPQWMNVVVNTGP